MFFWTVCCKLVFVFYAFLISGTLPRKSALIIPPTYWRQYKKLNYVSNRRGMYRRGVYRRCVHVTILSLENAFMWGKFLGMLFGVFFKRFRDGFFCDSTFFLYFLLHYFTFFCIFASLFKLFSRFFFSSLFLFFLFFF